VRDVRCRERAIKRSVIHRAFRSRLVDPSTDARPEHDLIVHAEHCDLSANPERDRRLIRNDGIVPGSKGPGSQIFSSRAAATVRGAYRLARWSRTAQTLGLELRQDQWFSLAAARPLE
jgi:hypothetical protein